MEIILSQFAGFCDGVKRAYEMINALDISKTKKPVCILGSLAHNADVVRKIEEKGIIKIDRKKLLKSKKGEIGTLIITAHGTGPEIFEIAKEKNIKIINTTCSKVIKVQRLTKVFSDRGYAIVLVGDKGHEEVEGINAWGEGKAQIISNKKDLEKLKFLKNEKIAVLSQTTQSEEFFKKVARFIKSKFSKAEIISTICYTTHDRQKEIRKIAEGSDLIIVIGSETSANSKRLFEIALSINQKSYFIENAKRIRSDWFLGTEKVAVTAGASTPSWVIKEVIMKLKKI